MLLRGYAAGIFPMADSASAPDIFWVEPRERAILPLDRFHLSKSLARRLRSGRFEVTCDKAFGAVLGGCADRDETWINPTIARAVMGLHAAGHAHSIETWHEGELVGGLYGVQLGGAFFGESMFSRMTDASKVALAWLVARLKVGGFTLLDCQFMTDHLKSLGATTVPRSDYLQLLSEALSLGSEGSPSPLASTGASVSSTSTSSSAPRFGAIDELLTERIPGGGAGPSGKLIAQLLGQTS
ncbi:leucyl/phenylalanyl-tRNA--protein transferase [Sphingomicrobium sediminis]|uniref:Leucyl/phenylalanyl-tRNA--protein transferase n=1 Tax=Sphingomicrobium sediminis TaxID=2950949 RepID=A0A9X2EG56_9SPHN|nr:leucyl/phenylalanyl-tRNA--protein transferase [Sphingomicrobium sediminis]MCM8557400.1 leucyl/phenylalanyl-tRNA--protein transferase [Sphingomicrobium sediminis]